MSQRLSPIRNPQSAIRNPKVRNAHRAFTLLELVMSIAITAILLMGMSASIVIASRAVGDGTDVVGKTVLASDTLAELSSDISSAKAFVEQTSDSVTVIVQDRDGDGQDETLKYRWTGADDGRLMRQINAGAEVVLAEDVRQFSLSYGLAVATSENMEVAEKVFTGRSRRGRWGEFWDHNGNAWGLIKNGNGNGNGNDKDK